MNKQNDTFVVICGMILLLGIIGIFLTSFVALWLSPWSIITKLFGSFLGIIFISGTLLSIFVE